jgi:hypothetical protein
VSAEENARIIIRYLEGRGFLLNEKAYRESLTPDPVVGETVGAS